MKMAQYALDRDEEDRIYEGPDQEAPGFQLALNAVSHLVDGVCVFILMACGFVWLGIWSGSI